MGDNIYQFEYAGVTLKFSYIKKDHISMSWEKGEFYEQKLLEKIKSLGLNGVYVDVGGHHGNHSIYFDKFCNSEKVVCIEGNPFNFEYLKKNTILNDCKNILYNEIVSEKQGDVLTMVYDLQNTGSSMVVTEHNKSNSGKDMKSVTNTTNTLDNILGNEDNISLIKIDIENYEYNALSGAQYIIDKHHPVIVIELHPDNIYYDEIRSFFDKNNYTTDNVSYAFSPTFIYM